MASNNEEFIQYHIFLKNINDSEIDAQDSEVMRKAQNLRKLNTNPLDAEGEVIYWILKYLDDKKCPTKLIAPIVRSVLDEIKSDTRYKSINPETNVNCDLKNLAFSSCRKFCHRLLDNVELNKIIGEASSPQLNDDLLSIPIRTSGASINVRRTMEDRNICIDEFHTVYNIEGSRKSSFYGVFDGHHSYTAAHYAASQLPYVISKKLSNEKNSPTVLFDAFKQTDDQFNNRYNVNSGTTATCVLYSPEESRLLISWVGDSKALLVKKHGKIMQLVTSHRPDLKREKDRIYSLKGVISLIQGVYRVNGVSEVTRSIGDSSLKKFLISTPDCVLVEMDSQEEFLVLATDGLWDFVESTEVARTVYDCIKKDCGAALYAVLCAALPHM